MKVLWMSDSPALPTGFGRVTKELLGRLAAPGDFDILCLGWYQADWHPAPGTWPYPLYPGGTRYGRDVLERAIEQLKPEVLVTLGDLWMVDWIAHQPFREKVYWIGYFPLDGHPLPTTWRPLVQSMDVPVVCAEFGRAVIREALPDQAVEFIPFGVDPEVFKPLPERAELRAKLLGGTEAFVVGCVARNQPRKNLPCLIKALSRFREHCPEAFLYLHTAPLDLGWNIPDLLARYGLTEHSCLTKGVTATEGVDEATLNRIYNLFDVFVLPSSGEGFGLPLLEAMAAGVPVVATDYSAMAEWVASRGELIAVKDFLTIGAHNIEQALLDVDDLVQKLRRLQKDPRRRSRHRAAGLEFAHRMTWAHTAAQWQALLNRVRETAR